MFVLERIMSADERIRRAEQIYNRRKMQTGVRVPTNNVNTTVKNKYKLYKKLIIQILICFIIYSIMFLIKDSNYVFSKEFINKTKDFLSYDVDFGNLYNSAMNFYYNSIKTFFNKINTNEINNNNALLTNEVQNENVNEDVNKDVNEVVNDESIGGIGGGIDENIEVSADDIYEQTEPTPQLSQMEIDANYVKETHSITLPLTGIVSSRFGPRQATDIISPNHKGIDIAVNEGTVFIAAMSGIVTVASSEGTYGNHIFIQDGDITTVYAHCKKLYVKEGDRIFQGQELGEVGQTGNATGPHLHFEIRREDRAIDPELILEFT